MNDEQLEIRAYPWQVERHRNAPIRTGPMNEEELREVEDDLSYRNGCETSSHLRASWNDHIAETHAPRLFAEVHRLRERLGRVEARAKWVAVVTSNEGMCPPSPWPCPPDRLCRPCLTAYIIGGKQPSEEGSK